MKHFGAAVVQGLRGKLHQKMSKSITLVYFVTINVQVSTCVFKL